MEVSSHWTLAYSSIARHFNQIVFPAILFSARFSFWHSLITQHCRRNYGTLISCHILVFHSFLNHGGREIKFLYNCNYHLPDRLTCPSFHFSSWSLWVFVLSCSVTGLIKFFFPIPNSFCTANFMDFLYPIYHSLLAICITHICAVYGHLSLMNAFILRIENSHSMPSILFILHRVCGFEIIWKTSPSITFIVFACIFEL